MFLFQKYSLPARIIYSKISAIKITPLMLCECFNAPVLLESAFFDSGKGRFSIVLLQEAFRLVKDSDVTSLIYQGERQKIDKDFLLSLSELQALAPQSEEFDNILPVPLGGVGYFGYEFFSEIENVSFSKQSLYKVYENAFIFGRAFGVFDHFYEEVHLFCVSYEGEKLDLESQMQNLIDRIARFSPSQTTGQNYTSKVISGSKENYYKDMVETIKQEIYKGNLLQCVVSQSMQIESDLPALRAYMNLRAHNPSPYMYYYNFGDFEIIGSSPEVLLKVESSDKNLATLIVRPIAGTRARGKTPKEDQFLEQQLKINPKENAEHLMLLDLGRNDVGKVAKIGSVEVTKHKIIEKYASVMHLVSEVQGQMDLSAYTKIDALLASFPAGTVSGAPKIAAIKLIESLESHRRDIYAGAIGYFKQNGDMNFAITIRTAVLQDGVYYLQAGGGIVYDSNAQDEFEETQNKMHALVEAITNNTQNISQNDLMQAQGLGDGNTN